MICIYHANCADGFAAATIVKHNCKDIKMFPGVHGEAPPDVKDEYVVIVDFSYCRDYILDMAREAEGILIIDHHKTAQEQLVDLPSNVEVIFDMNKSGAGLAWEAYHWGIPMPKVIQFIQDRDLWKFEIEWTKEFSAGLFSVGYDFINWDYLIYEANQDDIIKLIDAGEIITLKQTKDINELIASCAYRMEICGYNVPVLNVPYMYASEAGSTMCKSEPFAATYYDTGTTRNFSLRSTNEGIDVSEIAVKMGGGGHRNASGYKVSRI